MKSSRPRIGLSMDTATPDEYRKVYELAADYAHALLNAGALPVPLAHTADAALRREFIGTLDGLLIPGGGDIDPALWNEPPHPSIKLMDPERQNFDLALLGLADELDLPTLGICLGCQLMNVQRGGSLHQSIASAFPESPVRHCWIKDPINLNSSFHEVSLRPGTRLASIYGEMEIRTNSRHRQAVHDLGHDLIASAFAPDGILEALEDHKHRFWVGVQWHPENLARELPHRRLFEAFVAAAREFRGV